MKKIRIRSWVKVVITIGIVIMLLSLLAKLNNDFIKDCVNSGYSESYCRGVK